MPGSVTVIPQNKERYISFTKHVEEKDKTFAEKVKDEISFRFIDSFRFMASSLDKLASYLSELQIVEKEFTKEYTPAQIELLKRKGVFPYDYISSFDKLKEIKLPSQEDFYNDLNNSHISNDDYDHAKKVWEAFSIQSMGEYSDIYLKTDVLLLADVFEAYRSTDMKTYGLDPAHYYTTPGM